MGPAGPAAGTAWDTSQPPPNTLSITVSGGPPRQIRGVTIAGETAMASYTSGRTITASVPAGVTLDENTPICLTLDAGLRYAPSMTETTVVQINAGGGFGPADPRLACHNAQPIAFQSNRGVGGDYDIWIYDPMAPLGPSNPVDVTPWEHSNETAPAWSLSSAQAPTGPLDAPLLAFASDKAGRRDLYLLDPTRRLIDGVNPSRITTDDADDANPDFSEGGGNIAFESTRGGQADIWTLDVVRNPTGGFRPESGVVKVTDDLIGSDQPPGHDPSWLGAGHSIIFHGPDPDNGDSCALQLAWWPPSESDALPANGRVPTFTAPDAGIGSASAVWSPFALGDDAIVYDRETPGGRSLFRADLPDQGIEEFTKVEDFANLVNAAVPTRISSLPGRSQHPSWQSLPWEASMDVFKPVGRVHRRHRKKRRAAAVAAAGAPCRELPRAAFTTRPRAPRPHSRYSLDASASSAAGGAVEAYEWDLNADGVFERRSAGSVLRTTFPSRRPRTIRLRVIDDDGAPDITEQTVAPRAKCPGVHTPRGYRVIRGDGSSEILTGDRGRDVICGRGGNDRLRGKGGKDIVIGGPGHDRLDGGRGADKLSGGSGRDVVRGRSGRDRLRGGRGRDRLSGNGGRDRLEARDRSRDIVKGGPGHDVARVDRRDRRRGIEEVRR
jgi:hypothetical protein